MNTTTKTAYPATIKILFASLIVLLLIWIGLVVYLFMQDEKNAIYAFENGRFVKIEVKTGSMTGNIMQPEKGDEVVSREEYIEQRTKELTGKTLEEAQAEKVVENAQQTLDNTLSETVAKEVAKEEVAESESLLKALNKDVRYPLAEAPNPALIETVPTGKTLPKISDDGTVVPYQYYGKKIEVAPNVKKISLVITNLGFDAETTKRAVEMDERVTLAVSPYAEQRAQLITLLRSAGFETWMMLPMQHENYPVHDYGPLTLLNEETLEANRNQLLRTISDSHGIAGLIASPGEKFSHSKQMLVIFDDIANRGLLFTLYDKQFTTTEKPHMLLHARPHLHGGNIPADPDQLFRQIEAYANSGSAVITMAAMPAIMDVMDEWIATLPEKNIALVPLSMQVPAEK